MRPRSILVFLAFAVFILAFGSPSAAQPPADPAKPATATPPPPAQPSTDEDDDAVLRPIEPDFTVINLPTTLPLPVGKGNFHLSHRFNGNLENGSFGDQLASLFGIDEGANVGLEFRYGVI